MEFRSIQVCFWTFIIYSFGAFAMQYFVQGLYLYATMSLLNEPLAPLSKKWYLLLHRLAITVSKTPFLILEIFSQLVRPEYRATQQNESYEVEKPKSFCLESLLEPRKIDDKQLSSNAERDSPVEQ